MRRIKITGVESYKDSQGEHTVCKGKLLLTTPPIGEWVVDCILWRTEEGKLFKNAIDSYRDLLMEGCVPIKPIIISETEKIEVSDKYLYKACFMDGTVKTQQDFDAAEQFVDTAIEPNMVYINRAEIGKNAIAGIKGIYKIIAFPENFSPKHLRAIIEGKLRDGDEAYVKCEEIRTNPGELDSYTLFDYQIALFLPMIGHIKLFPIKGDIRRCYELCDIEGVWVGINASLISLSKNDVTGGEVLDLIQEKLIIK